MEDPGSVVVEDECKALRTPKIVGGYQILEDIAEGNWGKVKRGLKVDSNQEVALKVFFRPKLEKKIKDGVRRLYRYASLDNLVDSAVLCSEFELVRSLDHPQIIKYFDIFESNQKLYLAMQLGGVSLDVLRDSSAGPLDEAFINSVMSQLLHGIVYLETQCVAHHDVKPANILVDQNGSLLLCDFGVAERYSNTNQASCHSFFGTPTFQSPEIAGNVSGALYNGPKADAWSAGVVLYYLLTGTYPFVGETVYLLLKSVEEDPVVIPDSTVITNELIRDLLKRMLEKDPEARLSAAEALQHPWFSGKVVKQSFWKSIKQLLFPSG